MPTPFTHLATAPEILAAPVLPAEVRAALMAQRPAFLLGNIAPDVQTVSGQPREATHFFPVPLNMAPPAQARMFRAHRRLARRAGLPPGQAAFVAGYVAHLVLDQRWVAEIFEPVFGPQQTWGSFRERLYLHNVLRAHWDDGDLARLPAGLDDELRAARPEGWLPFEADAHLVTWRDLVADQLGPGAGRTVEVFAQRMRADPAALAALLADPAELERRLFVHVSLRNLERYRAAAVQAAAEAIAAYWAGG
jgi:hypothetical protein